MQTRHLWCFLLPLLILLLACMPMNEARGGRRGGGGMFGTWRKIKKPSSSSSSSSRRMQGQKSEVPYTPLKSSTYSKTASYPKQMPAGATYHASSAHLPAGATYHGVAVPPGGSYLASGMAMPPGAVYIAQTPPRTSFNTGNFLMGMYAGHMLGHGLLGHRTGVNHVYHDNQQQQQQTDNQKDKVIIIENGVASGNYSAQTPDAVAPLWPTDDDVPLAVFNTTVTPPELLQVSTEPIFQRSEQEQQQQPRTISSSNEQLTPMPVIRSPLAPPVAPTSGIICMPLLVNETVASDGEDARVQQVEKIVCYPAPTIPETAPPPVGIICVPQTVLEVDTKDTTRTIEVEKQNCYPAPAVPEEEEDITKSPDSVIGNIPGEGETEGEEEESSEQQQEIDATLKSLGEEERLAMKDILTEVEHKN